jgi:hypothetical protein
VANNLIKIELIPDVVGTEQRIKMCSVFVKEAGFNLPSPKCLDEASYSVFTSSVPGSEILDKLDWTILSIPNSNIDTMSGYASLK